VALFCVTYNSGLNLYCQIKPHNLTTVWNGEAFVAYDVGDWADYVVTLTESTPGAYYGTWPTGFATGYYDIFVYHGATPASTDPLIGSGTEYGGTSTSSTIPEFGGRWLIRSADEDDNEDETLYLNNGDERYLAFDFQTCREIQKGVTVSNASITSTAGVTISGIVCSGRYAVALFTGSANATAYVVNIIANLSNGTQLEKNRKLLIS